MKALAAEMTNYFSKRLEPLGITVKELTGDMQLSKGEILRTQVCLIFENIVLHTSVFFIDTPVFFFNCHYESISEAAETLLLHLIMLVMF